MADIPPPPPQPTPGYQPPPPAYQPPPPAYQPPPPPASPGYMAPPITPTSGRLSLGAQLIGAAYSMGIGVVGIIVPVISAFLLGGTVFYFYLLPLFGAIYGIRAITRGFVLGGIIGIVLNVVAGLVSLTASGLINPGG